MWLRRAGIKSHQRDHVAERGLGSILVHHLGASEHWRIGLQTQGTDEGPEPELEPLPTIDKLRKRWQAEWVAVDAWPPTLNERSHPICARRGARLANVGHDVNHGTQLAEAAALLTAEGRSAGELDLINYAEERAGGDN